MHQSLLPNLVYGANVVFVGSATEDPGRKPAVKAGFRGGRYISAEASLKGEWWAGGSIKPGMDAYATSKHCNIVTALALARENPRFHTNTIEPGIMFGTGLHNHMSAGRKALLSVLVPLLVPLVKSAEHRNGQPVFSRPVESGTLILKRSTNNVERSMKKSSNAGTTSARNNSSGSRRSTKPNEPGERPRITRQATFERIVENAPAMFTAVQLRVLLHALINLDPYDFAEDVAACYVGDNENNQQTPEEVLASTLTSLPDEKLTGFAIRLAFIGHTDSARESDFDFLAEAENVFAPAQPIRAAAKKASKTKPIAAKPKPAQKTTIKRVAVSKKKIAAYHDAGASKRLPLNFLKQRLGRTPFGFSRTLIPPGRPARRLRGRTTFRACYETHRPLFCGTELLTTSRLQGSDLTGGLGSLSGGAKSVGPGPVV